MIYLYLFIALSIGTGLGLIFSAILASGKIADISERLDETESVRLKQKKTIAEYISVRRDLLELSTDQKTEIGAMGKVIHNQSLKITEQSKKLATLEKVNKSLQKYTRTMEAT